MRNDYKVGDELYKIRHGKKIGYYKIKIVSSVTPWGDGINHYEYIKKGSSKAKRRKLVGKNILAYKNTFFNDKLSLLTYLDHTYNISTPLSTQIIEEIERSKINSPEYWV